MSNMVELTNSKLQVKVGRRMVGGILAGLLGFGLLGGTAAAHSGSVYIGTKSGNMCTILVVAKVTELKQSGHQVRLAEQCHAVPGGYLARVSYWH